MAADLNPIAALQLHLTELNVQFGVVGEALHGTCEALVNIAEAAVARGEHDLAQLALDAADAAADKVRALSG